MAKYGLSDLQWNKAKDEIYTVLIHVAKAQSTIYYSDLALKITAVHLDPNSHALHHLIGDISKDEDAAGRGMLSVVVINKSDNQPGGGFFQLAEELGKDFQDQEKFRVEESRKVYLIWSLEQIFHKALASVRLNPELLADTSLYGPDRRFSERVMQMYGPVFRELITPDKSLSPDEFLNVCKKLYDFLKKLS